MDRKFKDALKKAIEMKRVMNANEFKHLLDKQGMESVFFRTDLYLPNSDTYVIFKERDRDRDELIEGIKAVLERNIETFLILKDGKIISAKGKEILVLSRNDIQYLKTRMKNSSVN
jgi:predicted transcriptional regulator